MKSILDPSFHYIPSASTDLRKTFARVQRKLKAAALIPSTDSFKNGGAVSESTLAALIKLADRR